MINTNGFLVNICYKYIRLTGDGVTAVITRRCCALVLIPIVYLHSM